MLVVDVQRDFCAGGALAVPEGDRVVPVLNEMLASFGAGDGSAVYASRDWHPAVTTHFRTHGGAWPPHCVAGTTGAEFHPRLELPADTIVITKGDQRDADGYSAFDGRTPDGRTLVEDLEGRGIEHVYVGGLATDYCVRHSVLDARRLGLHVTVVADAVRAVELAPGDAERAWSEMRKAGARVVPSTALA